MPRVGRTIVGETANNIGGNEIRDLANALKELASPIGRGEKVMVAVQRAAKRCGIGEWRAFNIWYGKAVRVEESERAAIAAALDKKNREAARNEFHELKTRLAILESRIARVDEDFHREDAAQIRQQIRGLGGSNRPRD